MTTQISAHPESAASPARKPADVHSAAELGAAVSSEVRGRLCNAMDSSKARLTEWKGGFEDGVRARPIQSVLIAAAVGTAIGLIVARRSR